MFFSTLAFLEKEYDYKIANFLKIRGINKSDLQIKVSYFDELIDEVIELTRDYNILFHLATLATPKNIGVLGYMMLHSENIAEALNKMCKYYLIIGKSIKPVFIETDTGYKIGIYENNGNNELLNLEKYKAQIHLFAIVHLINNITNQEIKPTHITFIQDKPNAVNQNNKLNIKIEFNSNENAIYFDKHIQSIQTEHSNNNLAKVFEQEAQEILKIKLVDETLRTKITGLILVSTSELDTSISSIANKAQVSVRTLQNNLKKEGVSYSEILEDVRKKLSAYYLIKGIDIETISVSLGFSDLSSFFRAFKKWHLTSPRNWLKENKK